MAFPIKTCILCSEEFELRPGKPGFANRCPACSEPDAEVPIAGRIPDADAEMNEARRHAIRDLLYRQES
jgi:hypothetical protein